MYRNKRLQFGFTLYELQVAMIIFGIMTAAFAPLLGLNASYANRAREGAEAEANNAIVSKMLTYAKTIIPGVNSPPGAKIGEVPPPLVSGTAGGLNYVVADPASASTASANYWLYQTQLRQAGLTAGQVVSDGSPSARARVYQLIPLTEMVPFYLGTGDPVVINYQWGTLYTSDCESTNTACNNGVQPPTSTVASPILNATAPASAGFWSRWVPSPSESGVVTFSTKDLQLDLLRVSTERVDTVRAGLLNVYRQNQLIVAPGDTSNYYPREDGTGGVNNADFTATLSANQGCYDTWLDLSDSNIAVLDVIGLNKNEYGKTAWGGRIEYCRDFVVVTGTQKAANARQNIAALRINKTITNGSAPDPVVASNNLFLVIN